nr:acyltransferase [Sulfurospirillum sp. DNRA8]
MNLNSFFAKNTTVVLEKEKNISLPISRNISCELDIFFYLDEKSHLLENIFQTSSINSGIRAEFGQNNELWVLTNDLDNKLLGINISQGLLQNQENHLYLQYYKNRLLITINNQKISNNFVTLNPVFDNVMIGQGFDQTRIFSGQVKPLLIQYKNIQEYDYAMLLLTVLILSILLILILLYTTNDSLEAIYKIESKIYNKNQINHLLSIRAIAWIMVFVIHTYIIFNYNFQLPENKFFLFEKFDISFFLFTSPWAGVWIFFVLSGFLMGKNFTSQKYNFDANGIKNFYMNRVIQIFPIYLLSVFVVSIFMHPEIFQMENIKYLFRVLTFTNDSELPININGALWTLSTEIQFYILVPFLVIILDKSMKSFNSYIVFWVIVLLGLSQRTFSDLSFGHEDMIYWGRYIYKPLFSNLDLFLIGMSANFFIHEVLKKNLEKFFNYRIAIILFFILFFINSFIGYKTFIIANLKYTKIFICLMPSLTAIVTAYLITCLEVNDIKKQIIVKKMSIIHYFGMLTFPIYVWHEPLLMQVNKILVLQSPFFMKFIVGLVLTTCFAMLMYYFIEKPMRVLKKQNASAENRNQKNDK